ncbi:hypothetical protein [Lachnobacterium bovis]|uniref:hypothetical protein n=1 Tax=Lachnobacterium bovis TaxID=140626 RepID=UPI00048A58F5|nr:hypothetical protein [Lachnobacterium bovis]
MRFQLGEEITLDEIEKPDIPFEGYPIYKRSPRIIYRVPDDQIEIKSPPSKKTMGARRFSGAYSASAFNSSIHSGYGSFSKERPLRIHVSWNDSHNNYFFR